MSSILNQNHSLKSINSAVIARYHDRPLKLRNHLPFAVDYNNNSLQQNSDLAQSSSTLYNTGSQMRPLTAVLNKGSNSKSLLNEKVPPNSQTITDGVTQIPAEASSPQKKPQRGSSAFVKFGRKGAVEETTYDTGSNELTNSDGKTTQTVMNYGYNTTQKTKKIKIKDLLKNPPVYREEDLQGLCIRGKNVYQGEKQHLMNMLDELLTVE